MAIAGYDCALTVTGTSTNFTGEAFTDLGTGEEWQITGTAKRVWNANTIPTFYDNGVEIDEADIAAIDYLFGVVTFTAPVTGPVTADGAYFPLLTISTGYEFSLDVVRSVHDCTVFGDTAYRRQYSLLDATGEISVYDTFDTDLDPGGDTRTFKDLLDNSTLVVFTMSIGVSGTPVRFRALGFVTELNLSAGVDDLVTGTVSWESSPITDADGRPVNFSSR